MDHLTPGSPLSLAIMKLSRPWGQFYNALNSLETYKHEQGPKLQNLMPK